ncbi:hypothetical protein [Nocardia tengchongensis]
MPIVPDAKDWTWVLERTCAECGFDSMARYFLHDLVHHVHDVERG